MSEQRTVLKGLVVTRVDLVDLGDNPRADVVMFKRRPVDKASGGFGVSGGKPTGDSNDDQVTCPNCDAKMKGTGKKCPDCGQYVAKGTLTAAQRNALPDSDFAAVWTDASGKKQRALPIHDKAHVTAALGGHGVDATKGIPPKVKATARRKIAARAKQLGVGVTKAAGALCVSCDAPTLSDDATCPGCGEVVKVMGDTHLDAPIGGDRGDPTKDPTKATDAPMPPKPPKKKKGKGKVVKCEPMNVEGMGQVVVVVVDDDDDDEEDDDGMPATTGEILVEDAARNKLWEIRSALNRALEGVMYSDDLTADEKQASIAQSLDEAAAAVRQLVPTEVGDVLDTLKRATEGAMQEIKVDLATIPEAHRVVVKALVDRLAVLEPIAKSVDALKAENADLKKAIPPETEEQRIAKSLPESVRKRLESLEEKDQIHEVAKRHAELPLRGLTTMEKFAPILYRLEKNATTEEDRKEVVRILKAAGEQAKLAAIITREIGADGTGESEGGDPA
jgi:hypothetical protein